MPMRRSVETMERDARAADLFRRGLSYRQIAAQMGYKTPSTAFTAVRRAAHDAAASPLVAAETREILLERLQDYRRLLWRVATAKHYVVTQAGTIVLDPETDLPLLDDAPVLQAVDRLLRCDQEQAKLADAYPALKARVQVITEEDIDAQLSGLARQVAANDAIAAAADSRTGPARAELTA
jgi:hypothetical protein